MLVCISSVELATCTSKPVGTRPAVGAEPQVKMVVGRGGNVTVALPSVPVQLNPWAPGGDTQATFMIMSLVWPSAFWVTPQLQSSSDEAFITSAELVKLDPQTVVYKIAPNAVWSDGVPISASDFIYAWQAHVGLLTQASGKPVQSVPVAGYGDIASVSGSDGGSKVTVVFKSPFADWESLFSYLVPAGPTERYGWARGYSHFDAATQISGGPMVVTAFQPGKKVVLSRNPRWWGTPCTLSRITVVPAGSSDQLAGAMGSGAVQLAETFPSQGLMDDLSSKPNLSSLVAQGTTLVQLDFNVASGPAEDPRVRQAIADLLDRNAVLESVVGNIDPQETVATNFIFASGESGYEQGGQAYQSSHPKTGLRLLADAGYTLRGGRVIGATGQPLVIRMLVDAADPWAAPVASTVQSELSTVGVQVAVDTLPEPVFDSALVPGGAWDMAVVRVPTGPYPSQVALRYLPTGSSIPGSAGSGSQGPANAAPAYRNDMGFDDPLVTSLIASAESELNANMSQLIWQQDQKAQRERHDHVNNYKDICEHPSSLLETVCTIAEIAIAMLSTRLASWQSSRYQLSCACPNHLPSEPATA